MASALQTAKALVKVNLYCKECDSQVGIFKNEWTHLTPSYASPREKGKDFGIRIGDTTKKVPDGVVHKMAAGCEMAEIFCESCNMHIGQHCEGAPDSKKAQMVGQHFYKFSKTYLKCAKTAKSIDPVFADGEDFTPSTPKRRTATARASSPETRRKSTPPPNESVVRDDQRDGSARTPPKSSAAEDQNALVNRLADLERLVRTGGFAAPANAPRTEVYGPPPQPYGYPYAVRGPSNLQHDQIIEDQRKQIASITAQVDSLRGSIEDLRGVIQDLRAEKTRQQPVSLQESAVMNRFDEMIKSVRDGQNTAAEADNLRAENRRLKESLSTIAGAMSVPSDGSEEEAGARSSLGKRKRGEEHPGRSSFRSSDAHGKNGGFSTTNSNDQPHPPSPESLQEPMNGRGGTPATRHLPDDSSFPQQQPSIYDAPPLRHQYSDPGMVHYPTPGPNFGTPYPNENMYADPIERVARQEVAHITRPESRLGRRTAATNGGRRLRNRASDDDHAVSDNVEFSDDEIATPAPGDAPLSVPCKRPALPMFTQHIESALNRRGVRMGSTFASVANADMYQDPLEGRASLQAPVQSQPYRPPPFPKPGTCTSLRQPAEAPGMNNALYFTRDEVAKRVRKKKAAVGQAASGKEGSCSSADAELAEPRPIPIPVNPALERLGSRGPSSAAAKSGAGNITEGEDAVMSRPTRSFSRKKDKNSSSARAR